MSLKGIGKLYRKRLSQVLSKGVTVLDAQEVSRILEISESEANRMLSRWCKSGWVNRIKRGSYIPQPIGSTIENLSAEEPFVIAQSLYGPGYLGGISAIKHWDFTEQVFELTTFFSTKNIKVTEEIVGGIKYRIKKISAYKVFGNKTLWFGNTKIVISDPTKTIVDCFDDPSIIGGMSFLSEVFDQYLDSKYYDYALLIGYSDRMKNRTIFKRLGFLMESKNLLTEGQEIELMKKISKGLSLFDPTMKPSKIISKWNLKIPASWIKAHD